jgi:hypothetical protein
MTLEASMALVLGLAVGDVVDIADYWIAVISVDSRKTATLITNAGQKIPVSSEQETEIAPTIWVQLGTQSGKRQLKLLFTAPRSVSITRRHGRDERTHSSGTGPGFRSS